MPRNFWEDSRGQAGLSGLLPSGGIKQAVNNVTGNPSGDANSFKKVLTEADLVTDAKSITGGDFTALGSPGFKVPAQEEYSWGFGAAEFQANQGYIYVDIQKDAGAGAQEGLLRVQQRDAQGRNIVTVFEERTNVLDGSKTTRDSMRPFPEQVDYDKVGRDSYLNFAMDPDATFTIGTAATETEVLAPVTVYPV